MKILSKVLFPIIWALSSLVAFDLGFSTKVSALTGLSIGLIIGVMIYPKPTKVEGN